ncbi:MAG: hypothetical protein ABI345_14930 [Jatrophihabitans sp.]
MTSAITTTRRNALGVSCSGLLAAVILLAGCSSSSSSGQPGGGGANSSTTNASTGTGSITNASTGTGAAAKATSTTSGSSGGSSVSLGGGSFCAIARNQEAEQAKQASAITGSTAQLKALEEKDAKLLPELLAIAPNAIKPDVAVLVAADQKLVTALRKVNYDFTKLDKATLASFSTPALTKATQNVTTYLAKTCGIKAP